MCLSMPGGQLQLRTLSNQGGARYSGEDCLHIASLSVESRELPHDAVQRIADALVGSKVLVLQQSSMASLQAWLSLTQDQLMCTLNLQSKACMPANQGARRARRHASESRASLSASVRADMG